MTESFLGSHCQLVTFCPAIGPVVYVDCNDPFPSPKSMATPCQNKDGIKRRERFPTAIRCTHATS
jgi:hypothetical protein